MPTYPLRRLTLTLFLGGSLTSAGIIAGYTVSTIIGARLSGKVALAGVPSTAALVGAALAAYPASRLMQRWGRRPGLSLGLAIGALGSALAAASLPLGSFGLFLLGLMLTGVARGITDLGRFAAAEIYPPERQARALSVIVLAGTVGAVFGPMLIGPSGQAAESLGADPLIGPWVTTVLLFVLSFFLIALFLRPDPAEIARAIASSPAGPAPRPAGMGLLATIFANAPARVAVLSMVFGQAVMVMIMAITSLHMTDHGHPLGDVSWAIFAHTLGMFGLSVVTGWVADRFGKTQAIAAGAVVLIAASLLAPVSQATIVIAIALFLLGLGWNLCYVAGSAMLTAAIAPEERNAAQGTADLVVNLTSAISTLGSGVVFALVGYAAMGLLCAAVGLVTLTVSGWFMRARPSTVNP